MYLYQFCYLLYINYINHLHILECLSLGQITSQCVFFFILSFVEIGQVIQNAYMYMLHTKTSLFFSGF